MKLERRTLKFGFFWIALYCGEHLFQKESWKHYRFIRVLDVGFSVGPVLFWREPGECWFSKKG